MAQKRLARGVKLNYVETIALLSSQLLELMRDGCYSVSQLMDLGKQMLGRRHVLPDVMDMVKEVQIEGTFPDGTYLVTVHDPICTDNGNIELALYGSFYPIPDESKFDLPSPRSREDAPGAVIGVGGPIELNVDRKRLSLTVTNFGDRAIQVQNSIISHSNSPSYSHSTRRLALISTLSKPTNSSTSIAHLPMVCA